MKYIMPIRTNLPFRTVFNILGPLANPAGAKRHVLGVYHPDLIKPMAQVLSKLGIKRGLVFSGYVPETKLYMDEISPFGVTHCAHIVNGDISYFDIDAREFNLQPARLDDIKGYTAHKNAKIAEKLFSGQLNTPIADVVKLNAAAGFYIAGRVDDIKTGVEYAQDVIRSGRVIDLLNQWRTVMD
jgi:anthranilate phosphoribosyltransferase